MTTSYRIIDKNSPEFLTYSEYAQNPYQIVKKNQQIVFLLNTHNHNVKLEGIINPRSIIELFRPIFPELQLTLIQVSVYGLSTTTEYFTHFVEYSIPYNIQYSFKVVYYLNKDYKTIYKYYIELEEANSQNENNSIFNVTYKEENGLKADFAYVSYNCFELGFGVSESCIKKIEPICKYCKYKSNNPMLRCSVHPTINHNQLTECKDFISIVD